MRARPLDWRVQRQLHVWFGWLCTPHVGLGIPCELEVQQAPLTASGRAVDRFWRDVTDTDGVSRSVALPVSA